MILSVHERLQFQYLLPVLGNLQTLEIVEGITQKIFIKNENEEEREFIFNKEEIQFLKLCINSLDSENKLSYGSLSVIRKIMEEII